MVQPGVAVRAGKVLLGEHPQRSQTVQEMRHSKRNSYTEIGDAICCGAAVSISSARWLTAKVEAKGGAPLVQ